MRNLTILLLILTCQAGGAFAEEPETGFAIYLVRHAERQADGSSDPALSVPGRYRSQHLAKWFKDKKLEDIWSSDYRRTRDTAGPLLSSLGLELTLYNPLELPELANSLLNRRHNALVVGHSNTTPELARLLCHCVVADMDESEYDRLIVVSFADGAATLETFTQEPLLRGADDSGS